MRTVIVTAVAALAAACSESPAPGTPSTPGVTRVETGPGLAGGPITDAGTISIAPAGVEGAMLAAGAVAPEHLAFDPATQLELDVHDHGGAYAAIGHAHDDAYAPAAHAHHELYAALVHGHSAAEVLDLAAAAVAAMGPVAHSNPLHHDRYTDAEAVAAARAAGVPHAHPELVAASGGTVAGDLTVAGTLEAAGGIRSFRFEAAPSPPYPCEAPRAGAAYLDTTANALRICTGSLWGSLPLVMPPGSTPASAARSCAEILSAGPGAGSGVYWIGRDMKGGPYLTWCEMTIAGGGWTLVHNSVLGTDTTAFWDIRYADRFARKGTPGLATNYYDGQAYLLGGAVLDVVEDLGGRGAVLAEASYTSFDTATMRLAGVTGTAGLAEAISQHVAGGWSAPDYDGDSSAANLAATYAGVTQHYGTGWVHNLGADGDEPYEDGLVGPHLDSAAAAALSLATDGTPYTRVRRLSRFVR